MNEKQEVFYKVPQNVFEAIKNYIANSKSDWKVGDINQLLAMILSLKPIAEIVKEGKN